MTQKQSSGDLRHAILTRDISGTNLTAKVSPCSWMYPNYGLQIEVSMVGGGKAYVLEKKTDFDHATQADMQRLFDAVRLCECKRCSKPAFDPKSVKTNRKGVCEGCFLAALEKQYARDLAKEAKLLEGVRKQLKSKGYTHHIQAWIHPEDGSDYQVDFGGKGKVSDKQIQNTLRAKGSVVVDDYVVTPL